MIQLHTQSAIRLENEFKISVPNELENEVWKFIQYDLIDTQSNLQISSAEEVFIDTYFDNDAYHLAQANSGLRLRKRYVADTLAKELVQLKISDPDQTLVRGELKFEVLKNNKTVNEFERHDILSRISLDDQEELAFNMVPFDVHPRNTSKKIKLIQNRRRIYISDGPMASLATLTLDRVTSLKFPFQSFIEMEIELNEIRYTNADEDEKQKLQEFNNWIQKRLMDQFPEMYIDQTPKYNKMLSKQDQSLLSKIYSNGVWLMLGLIIIIGGLKMI